MLVCPHCQFENPNTNKFCQNCGTSLTHKVCQNCGSQVTSNAERCQSCGAFTATVWWAVISKGLDWQVNPTSSQPEVSQTQGNPEAPVQLMEQTLETAIPSDVPLETQTVVSSIPTAETQEPLLTADPAVALEGQSSDAKTELDNTIQPGSLIGQENSLTEMQPTAASVASSESADPINIGAEGTSDAQIQPTTPAVLYLDAQKRYQLLNPLPPQDADLPEIEVRVMDCQPFQQSPLEVLMEQGSQRLEILQPLLTEGQEDSISISPESGTQRITTIPVVAKSYIALRAKFAPTLPAVHDAWYQDDTSVVLLEDRSEWPLLRDLWLNSPIPPLQILYWLDEMAKMWIAFTPWQCRQSLLEISNLRVDEDQSLSLQRLYSDTNASVGMQDLGQLWQILFSQGQQTQFLPLHQLFCELRDGKIETPDELRTRLEAIAQEIDASSPKSAASGITSGTTGGIIEESEHHSSEAATPIETLPEPAANPSGDTLVTTMTSQSDIQTASLTPPSPQKPATTGEGSEGSAGDDMPTIILPMQLLSLDDAGGTDIGRQRHHNEDFFGIQTLVRKQENPLGRTVNASGLYILCDGMGGHAGGEVASAMAVDTLRKYFQTHWQFKELPDEATIREAIRLANQAIYDVNQQNARSGSGRMGTTLVIVLIQDTKVAIAHVGDSRLYRLSRKRGIEQVTVDHEVGQREIQRGVDPTDAYNRPDAYQLTQALGPRDEHSVNPDIQYLELNEDTLLILCSDGLSDNDLLETHWQSHLLPLLSSRASLEQGVNQLIDLANQHNGHDNITAVLIRAKVRPNLDQQRWA